MDDFELMKEIQKESEEAFALLAHRYQKPLFHFFWHMGCSEEESEDLIQEVFLRLFSYRHRYHPKSKFATFLYTIAHCVWVDWRRKERKRPRNLGETAKEIQEQPSSVLQWETSIDVQAALEKLSEKLRLVVVMGVCQQLKYEEIAQILDIPVGTVKSRMHMALQELKIILSGEKSERKSQ